MTNKMARLFVQYLAICNNENLAVSIIVFPHFKTMPNIKVTRKKLPSLIFLPNLFTLQANYFFLYLPNRSNLVLSYDKRHT